MQAADLLELRDDLSREMGRLEQLVKGLSELEPRLGSTSETVEAAALRLHSFYTGVERMLLLVSRVVNGGTPSRGEGWPRHLVRNLYADELRFEPIQRLLNQLQDTWPLLVADIDRFQGWLTTVSAA